MEAAKNCGVACDFAGHCQHRSSPLLLLFLMVLHSNPSVWRSAQT
jgi:hypothetical protein